jgi:hypothetical protein
MPWSHALGHYKTEGTGKKRKEAKNGAIVKKIIKSIPTLFVPAQFEQ